MFELVAFKAAHVKSMELPIDERGMPQSHMDYLERVDSATGLIDGKPMVCGGIIPMWEGRGYVWTLFNEQSKDCFIPIFRGMKRFLRAKLEQYGRLEIAVPVNFPLGIRRAELLGFRIECPYAQKYLPGGIDAVLLSMVKE